MKVTDDLLYEHAAQARDIWLSALPSDDDIPEHRFSKRFERKIKLLLREQRRSPAADRLYRRMKTAAAVLLAAIVLALSVSMTVEAVREKIVEMVIQVFEDLTDLRFSSRQSEGELPDIVFEYIPDGMEEKASENYGIRRYIYYEDANGLFFELTQSLLLSDGSYQGILNTEGADTTYCTINGEDAVVNSKDGDHTVIWTQAAVVLKLEGTVPVDELVAIAQGIEII